MEVLVTGATGFLGRALVLRLLGAGHAVTAYVRSKEKARGALRPEVGLACGEGELREAVARADGVANLAGEPVLPRRWTASRKRLLVDSRVKTTEALVEAIRAAQRKPQVLVSAGAVGYYGARGEEPIDESARPGDGFLARLCVDWEAAARAAEGLGVRVAILRIGVVLGPDGGALAPMLPLFRLGLGGPLGSGRQGLSWIHLHDLVEVWAAALADERYRGAINAVAPQPASQRELAQAIGTALSRPAWLPAPAMLLKLALGEASRALLDGQRVLPRRLEELSFAFRFPALKQAVADVLAGGAGVSSAARSRGCAPGRAGSSRPGG